MKKDNTKKEQLKIEFDTNRNSPPFQSKEPQAQGKQVFLDARKEIYERILDRRME